MTDVTTCLAGEVDAEALRAFLSRFFGEAKSEFLMRYGTWWHRGDENRWVLRVDGVIAGYCAVISTTCVVAGIQRPALWWMDLVIAPEYRGQGLQTRFDDLVRERGALLLGFPNALAAGIHRHHGWGVREDLRTLLMPLNPGRLRFVQRSAGARGAVLRLAARVAWPVAALWRRRLRRYRPETARRLSAPDWRQLAAVAARYLDPATATTLRDEAFLHWRYAEGPHQCLVYTAGGDNSSPTVVLVARRTGQAERWLDLFGDLEDAVALGDLVRYAAGRATDAGMAQITVLAAAQPLRGLLRSLGFVLGSVTRFCWLDDDRETMEAISSASHHWCLGDSDNDEPDADEKGADEN